MFLTEAFVHAGTRFTVLAFGPWFGSNNSNKIFWLFQAAVTVICGPGQAIPGAPAGS